MTKLKTFGLSAALVFLGAAGIASAEEKPVVDRTGAVSVTPTADWKRDTAAEKKDKKLDAAFQWTGKDAGTLHPHFNVLSVEPEGDLDAVAKTFVDAAKKLQPDQQDVGTVSTSKVDGEDARTIVVRSSVNGHPTEKKIMIAEHNNVLYIFAFYCEPDDYADLSKEAGKLFDSLKWQ